MLHFSQTRCACTTNRHMLFLRHQRTIHNVRFWGCLPTVCTPQHLFNIKWLQRGYRQLFQRILTVQGKMNKNTKTTRRVLSSILHLNREPSKLKGKPLPHEPTSRPTSSAVGCVRSESRGTVRLTMRQQTRLDVKPILGLMTMYLMHWNGHGDFTV